MLPAAQSSRPHVIRRKRCHFPLRGPFRAEPGWRAPPAPWRLPAEPRVAATAQPAKPNIVFIMADDLGYADLSCYGRREYKTPNIDRIAAGGMRFLQAYANSAVCSATRTALITGRYQYRLPVGLEEPLASASTRDIGLPPSTRRCRRC